MKGFEGEQIPLKRNRFDRGQNTSVLDNSATTGGFNLLFIVLSFFLTPFHYYVIQLVLINCLNFQSFLFVVVYLLVTQPVRQWLLQ